MMDSETTMETDEYKDLTIRDYARLFDLPEPTVRSRIRLQKLKTVDVELDGRTQKAIRVRNDEIPTDSREQSNEPASLLKIINPPAPNHRTDYQMIIGDRDERIKELKETIAELLSDNQEKSNLIDGLKDEITQLRETLAGVKGELKGKDELIKTKDEVIQAKDQAVNAANAAVMLLEQRNQTLEAEEPKKLQGSQPQQAEEKKGWFDKILGR
jgi:chromosome segregation ATPase